ncbi:acyltransferase family protein [Leifsonia sp. SIMBA_070]|uniref:acyltransferase family protein n=2 Tax=Bacillati TaxID=1783272 RepID=UPI00397881DC
MFFTQIDQLRGIAALLVVYSHLVPNFLQSQNRKWVVDDAVAVLARNPVHAELNFGWLGVALFFFVSGFVVTHAASRERASVYVVRRLMRIYPPLIATAILVAILAYAGTLVSGLTSVPSPLQVLLGASLGNYFVLAQPLLVAVGWTLVIEMFFYLGLLVARPLLARAPALVPIVLMLAVAIVDTLHTQLGTTFALASSFVAFIPLLLLGQIVYLVRMRRIPVWAGALLAAAAWVVFVYGMRETSPAFYDSANSFLSNAVLGFCIFLVAVLIEGRVKPLKPLAVVAKRSYSLYLLHVPVGFTLLTVFVVQAHMPYTPSLLLSLLAVAAATELAYRFIERPSIRLSRWITSRPPFASRSTTTATTTENAPH